MVTEHHYDSADSTVNQAKLWRAWLTGIAIFVVALGYYGYAALQLPTLFNIDNDVNYAATRYLSEQKKLPVVRADDPGIEFTRIGTSRLTRPPFTFIVSAMVDRALQGVMSDRIARYRLGSPLIAALTLVVSFIGFQLAFRHIALACLGVLAIGALPKFLFLASCNNDDIGAIFSVSVLFTSVLALNRYGATRGVLCSLAAAIGLIFQTKFTAWLVLPWFGLFVLVALAPYYRAVVKQLPVLMLVLLMSGGWWVVFNMVHYGLGDPTGLVHAAQLQQELTGQVQNREGYYSMGVGLWALLTNHDQFLSRSYTSLIGYLEWLDLDVGVHNYGLYAVVFMIGLGGAMVWPGRLVRRQRYLNGLLVLVVLAQCGFYLHHNLLRDVQPQARYLLPVIVPLVYLFLSVLRRVPSGWLSLSIARRSLATSTTVSFALIILFSGFALHTWANYIRPVYEAQPFHVRIKNTRTVDIDRSLSVATATGLRYWQDQGALVLEREDHRVAELNLGERFCAELPVNALVSFRVRSPAQGGLYLRIENSQRKDQNAVWRGYGAGESWIEMPVRANQCNGVVLAMASNTVLLTILEWRISELRIHKHGTPI